MQKVVIVGGSGTLGKEICSKLLKEKIKIVNVSREKSDLEVENISLDLTNNEEISRMYF